MSGNSGERPPCAVCRGAYSEHFDGDGKKITQHSYTEKEGDLVTHEEAAKRSQPRQQQGMQVSPTMLAMQAGTNPLAMGRLIEVLLDKGVLTNEDALYVAGFSPTKPNRASGYADPSAVAGGRFGS